MITLIRKKGRPLPRPPFFVIFRFDMRNEDIQRVMEILKEEASRFKTPHVTEVSERTRDPFRVLVSCILSLRTKDETTSAASRRLFGKASTPEEMVRLPVKEIEELIYPVGFYRNKARVIKEISSELLKRYDGKVPETIEALTGLKGVGRKTANLVVTLGYGRPGICVDTHVHRITNRWGYVRTRTPEETERALREVLPRRYWIIINDLLVTYGQNICRPVSPRCSGCRLSVYCKRVGVERSR